MKKRLTHSLAAICFLFSAAQAFSQTLYTTDQIRQVYQAKAAILTPADLADFIITDQYTSRHNGVTHVYLRQRLNGVEIFNANSSIHFDRQGNTVQLNEAFVPNAAAKVVSSNAAISGETALRKAGEHIGLDVTAAAGKGKLGKNQEMVYIDNAVSPEPLKTKLFYLLTGEGKLQLVYNVEVFDLEKNDWWNLRVDAENGNVIDSNNWVVKCQFEGELDHQHPADAPVFGASDYAQQTFMLANDGTYRVFDLPIESPSYGNSTLVSSTAKTNASPYGWHDVNGVVGAEYTITRGNNVFAKEDTLATNGNDKYSPEGGPELEFDFPFDPAARPWQNMNASITNLFYWNNIIHDVFYQYGFDEPAGNFQVNNYGKGGRQNDGVQAEARDGSGTNNANFSTPADGQSGRMQMYQWNFNVGNNMFITHPVNIAKGYQAPLAVFGPRPAAPITGQLVLVNDASASPTLGCDIITNASELAGKIALIDRGSCSFTDKVENAQNAGAIAVIMINNTTATPTEMTGQNANITIPSVMISQANGSSLKTRLADSISVSLSDGLANATIFDSGLDNGVVTHEYGHGISNRLTGGPANANCLANAEQPGEGWSDFFALALTARTGDSANQRRSIATFVNNEPITGPGIRPYRYSRSMSVNPVTYNHIRSLTVPHGVGFVWCSMLWDIYWDMVGVYGYDADIYHGTGGNNKTIQLVIDGMKLQPCSPGFVDCRNAILKADSINNGGVNSDLLWRAFARRGLGLSAKQGSTGSRSDGTVAFDLPAGVPSGIRSSAEQNNTLQVYPNPAKDRLQVESVHIQAAGKLALVDILGKTVLEQNVMTDDNGGFTVRLPELAAGTYMLRFTVNEETAVKKVLIY